MDEVQRAPGLMDVGQDLIDRGEARFVFTGSSARKPGRGGELNLLPGRVVAMYVVPLTIEKSRPDRLEEALLLGSRPTIRTVDKKSDKEADLASYVTTYLEEEVRQEALGRNDLPIEVKLTDRPFLKDARHLLGFMKEYEAKKGVVICTSPRAVWLGEAVSAVPCQDLAAAISAASWEP